MAVWLPDELLFRIFCHLDLRNVARVDGVSRQWHAVSRDERLWRDALYIDDGVTPTQTSIVHPPPPPSAKLLRRRIEALATRCGGRVDRLALRLQVYPYAFGGASIVDEEDVMQILAVLPTLDVRQLWLECVGNVPDLEQALFGQAPPVPGRVHSAVLDALMQCRHLNELHIEGLSFSTSFAGTPLASCKLTHFSLGECKQVDKLFQDDTLLLMLAEATHVSLPSSVTSQAIEARHLWRLLELAHATLECVQLGVDNLFGGDEVVSRRLGEIHLPHLRALTLWDSRRRGEQFSGDDTVQWRLVCPVLRSLSLHEDRPLLVLRDCVIGWDASLTSLHLDIGAPSFAPNVIAASGVVKLLNDRLKGSLRRLTYIGGASMLLEELLQNPDVLVDDVIVLGDVSIKALLELVRSRCHSHHPIRTLVVAMQVPPSEAQDVIELKKIVGPSCLVHDFNDRTASYDQVRAAAFTHDSSLPLSKRRQDVFAMDNDIE